MRSPRLLLWQCALFVELTDLNISTAGLVLGSVSSLGNLCLGNYLHLLID